MRLRVLAVVRQLDAGRDDAGLAVEDRDLKGYHEKTGWRATLWRRATGDPPPAIARAKACV